MFWEILLLLLSGFRVIYTAVNSWPDWLETRDSKLEPCRVPEGKGNPRPVPGEASVVLGEFIC